MFEKRFFTCFSKIFQKIYLLFYVQKTIKECPVPLDISIKSNRKHHKTVLYSKSNKNMVGQLFGRFFIVFGQFFNRHIWSPWSPLGIRCRIHNTSFSLQLKSGPKKLECLFLACFSSLVLMQHSSLLCPFMSYEKMTCCEYCPRLLMHCTKPLQ